jgi:hypothetical protein
MGAGAAIAGGVIGAQGQIEGGLYSAQVERNNAKIAQQNAARATSAGYQAAQTRGLEDANVLGQIIGAEGANNIDSRSGSALAVQAGARAADAFDQGTIIHNALLQAYGYKTAAQSDKAQANQDLTAAAYNAAGALVGAAGNLPTSTAPADPGSAPDLSSFLQTASPTSSNTLLGFSYNNNYGVAQ